MTFNCALVSASLLAAFTSSVLADNVTVYLENNTSFDYNFEVRDQVCGVDYLFGIQSGGTRTQSFCSSGVHDSGYANIIYRKQGNAGWTEKALINDGDSVSLN